MPIKELTGQRFGRLIVIDKTNKRMYGGQVVWKCQCDCGNICEVSSGNLISGMTKSCGCLRKEYIDLTGQRFGRLTVIEKTDKRSGYGNVVWKCRCDCGNITEVSSGELRFDRTQSCGCLKINVLTGQRFGRLTVIEPTDKRKSKEVVWRCRCDCDNICEVRGSFLRDGRTQSCGCLIKDKAIEKVNDLTRQRFGKLTALEKTDKRLYGGEVVWKCQCDCGNICEVSSGNLVSGKTQSCGCLQKDMFNEYIDKECVYGTKLDRLSTKPSKVNKSGRRGVSWCARRRKWRAYIQFQHKIYRLGDYDKFEDAVKARERAEEEYWQPVLEENGRELE